MQCTYNVTLRCVHATTSGVEKQYVLHNQCVCSLRYPACNAHAPYLHLWPARLYYIFPHYLIKGIIFFNKKLLNIKCVFLFSIQLPSEKSLIPRTERDMIKNVYWSTCEVLVINGTL